MTKHLSLPLTAFLLFYSIGVKAQVAAALSHAGIKPTPSPIGFVENKGRFRAMDGQAHPELLFKLPGQGMDLYVTSKGLSYVARKIKKDTTRHATLHYEVERVDMLLQHANIGLAHATISYMDDGPAFNNYYGGLVSEKERPIRRIYFHAIYPGIDWVLTIQNDSLGRPLLKQDFILHPGADTRLLQVSYSRNAKVTTDGSGQVIINGRLVAVQEKKLLVYETDTHHPIPVQANVSGNRLSYRWPQQIVTREVTLDPILFWGTYLTSVTPGIDYNDNATGSDLVTDGQGNIYVQLNVTAGVDFPTANPGAGAYYQDITASPNGGMIIMKFNRSGVLLWSTFFGAGGMCIATDAAGNLFVAGIAANKTIPLVNNGGYHNTTPEYSFLAKFSNTGKLLWSTYAFDGDWRATNMRCDTKGDIYITGDCSSLSMPHIDPGGGAYKQTGPYVSATFIMQLTPDCNIHWSTQVDATLGYGGAPRVAIDNLDNVALGTDGNVLRFDGNLNLTARFYAGNVADLVVDEHGNTFVTGGGMYLGAALPPTDPGGGAFMDNSPYSGKATGYIAKFDPSNTLVWATTLTRELQTFMVRIVLDKTCDAVHVLGIMNDWSGDMPTVDNSCSNGWYYPAGSSYINTGPTIWTFKTTGQLIYMSITDFPYEYYDTYYGFAIDPFGSLVFLWGDLMNFQTFSPVKNPGGGAFFQPTRNNLNAASFVMKLNPSQMATILQKTDPTDCFCSGTASVTIQCGTPPYTYEWSNGATTAAVTGLCAGDYSVRVVDNFCRDTTIHFTIGPGPGSITALTGAVTQAHCGQSDGAINISSVTGGSATPVYSYSINSGPFQSSTQFTGLPAGAYGVHVKDQSGCPYTDSFTIADLPGPNAIHTTLLPSACNQPNGSIVVDKVDGGTAPYTYQLGTSAFQTSNSFTGLAANSYTLTAKDAAGCTTQLSIKIDPTAPPSSLQYAAASAHCQQADGSITINAVTGGTSPYTFSLDGTQFLPGNQFPALHSGTYDLYVQDARGCPYKSTATVPETAGPTALTFGITDALCDAAFGAVKTTAVQGGSTPYQYTMDGQALQSNGNFSDLLPGSHTLAVVDTYGCRYEAPFQIRATHSTPVIIFPKDSTVCYGQEIRFTARSGDGTTFDQLAWDKALQPATAYTKSFYQSGGLVVTATNGDGCLSWDTAFVIVKNCDSAADYCVQFPNAFTPNGDGQNDAFGPVLHCLISKYQLQIFDRYGARVFSTTQPDQRWDGIFEGRLQEAGAFVYTCEYNIGDIHKQVKGTIILVR